jgi:hypothetical protein
MLISLGYSCQTRFMIDALHADQQRQPFDFNITSRPALIDALATDGASLEHRDDNTVPHVMPVERREGIGVGGMYFWHDYPLREDKLSLHPEWREKMAKVNAKYAYLWRRFSMLIRSDGRKTFVLSNAQRNLVEFAAGEADFERKFGLGRRAFEEITGALDGYGARNYTLKFLSRSANEPQETHDLQGERLDHRHVGPLRLRVDPALAARLLSPQDEEALPASAQAARV